MLEAKNLYKEYKVKNGPVTKALDDVSVKFQDTGMVFILGKSGSGKSTLLNVLGGLDNADKGEIIVKGKSSKDFKQSDFDSYRNTFIGFIFQDYNILDEFTISKNIGLALELQGKKADKKAIDDLIEKVDLKGYGNRKPNTLSGGQKQRVAIARALVKEPEIIMADEPTGALDSNTGKQVLDTLKKLSETKLVIIVSHDRDFAELYGDRIIELADGKIISDISKYKAAPEVKNGLNVVDDKIVTLKKGEKLDTKKTKQLQELINNSDSDVVISIDEKSNKDFKKLAKIDDDGNKESFKNTDKVNTKEYDGNKFKLIKSRLPGKDSMKMGASGLKSKPIRLFFTILLSAVAFSLFGIADTMGSYDKVNNTARSLKDSKINYASFKKGIEKGDSSYKYYEDVLLSDADLSTISNQFKDLNFTPVFTKEKESWFDGYSFLSNISQTNTDSIKISENMSFYIPKVRGFAQINADNQNSIGELVKGRLPTSNDEIVITKYIYDMFNLGGYKDDSDNKVIKIQSYDDLLNKTINLNGNRFKIVGIIDTHLDSTRYETLKNKDFGMGNNNNDYKLFSEFNEFMKYSYHSLGYVNDGYYDSLQSNENNSLFDKIDNFEYRMGLSELGFDSYDENNQVFNINLLANYSKDKFKDNIYYINNTPIDTLKDDEAIIPLTMLYRYQKEINGEIIKFNPETLFHRSTGESKGNIMDNNSIDNIIDNSPKLQALVKEYVDNVMTHNGYDINNLEERNYLKDNLYNQVIEYMMMHHDYIPTESFELSQYNIMTKIAKGYLNDLLTNILEYLPTNVYVKNGWNYDSPIDTLKVVGFYIGKEGLSEYGNNLIFANKVYQAASNQLGGKYLFTISSLDTSNDDLLLNISKYAYASNNGVRYQLSNSVMSSMEDFNGMIEMMSSVFLYVGIGFAVFASLLLLNFITISISYKKREIGVLRAIGARGMDVFKIFFNESFIIALINFILATIGCIGACVLINNMARTQMGLLITLLNVGIRQILLMFGISVLVAFISSYFPVRSIAKKKPIDAIRSAE